MYHPPATGPLRKGVVRFRGGGGGGGATSTPVCPVCPKVKDMGPFLASSE